ncbi:Sec-independent protein translocase protein TatC [Verrucomicrobia bacterium]|nr:Sec-independent protein translocase protein TatC [Verrucomicrobiota bacterium]
MPEESDEWRPEQDEEGGPVKSFLEHLEDLRWVLIKSLVALGVAFVLCLVADNWVFAALTYPLKHAKVRYRSDSQVVTFLFGTNRLGLFQLPPEQEQQWAFGTNHFVNLYLEPIHVGTNLVLGLRQNSDPTEALKLAIPIVSLSPAGAFMVAVSVAAYAGTLLSSPFILYFVASFVFPALKMKERKYVYRGMFYGLGLFLFGVAFCYFILLPVALSASVVYTQWLGLGAPQWRAEEYVSFVSKFMLGMGLGFEMPVIILVLVKIGVLNYAMLSKARRYVVIINFFLGAVLTTPEILTQILMALPLQILFEITVWVAWYWERQEKKRDAAAEAAAGNAVRNA